MSTNREKMVTGELYTCVDDAIVKEQTECLEKLYDYNATRPSETKKRIEMLKEMCAECGDEVYIEPPFHANWGGKHCHFGRNVYANFNLTCVDDNHIYVGEYTMIGPNVVLSSAAHPILPELREKIYQYNIPVHIGKNCWLGAGVIVLPGVTIGDGSVIGAGSVVTKDIPAGVVAYGTPCEVKRKISERDREYYYKDKKINWDEINGVTKSSFEKTESSYASCDQDDTCFEIKHEYSSFYEEIKDYSIDDLKLIISTQQNLYTSEEMNELKDLLKKKMRGEFVEEPRQSKKSVSARPSETEIIKKREKTTRICPKCGGPNTHAGEICVFCDAVIDDESYEYDTVEYEEKSRKGGNGWKYILSFLIPIVGFIMGGIMAANKDEDVSSAGKTCIGVAVFSVIASVLFSLASNVLLFMFFRDIFDTVYDFSFYL